MSDAQNLQAQANARYILYGVREDESNFPRFNPNLTEKTHQLAYLYLEVACDYYGAGRISEASSFFERGAELLEHNNVTGVKEDDLTNFNRLVGSLAYYCACQYSKAFILLKDRSYETNISRLLWLFLTKQLVPLEDWTKQILLGTEKFDYESVYEILLARTLELTVNYFYYGQEKYLEEAVDTVKDAFSLALLGSDPAIWWLFRLVRILIEGIQTSSLWANVGHNSSYKVDDGGWLEVFEGLGMDYQPIVDNSARLKLRQYINSLSFRKHPVTELFLSQRKALEKVLGVEGAVVSMPTSSGKTRIAELVILQTLIYDSNSKILYIAPYRSLSYEMEETLGATFNPMDYYVTHLYGSAQYTAIDRQEMEQARVVIATPEKAKAILRANDEMVESIRLVIMDEGHLLGAGQREVANEMFSEELRRIVNQNHGRFLVLSAVLPNAEDMSLWLARGDDHVVKDTWRPSSQRFGKMLCYPSKLDIEWIGEPRCFNPSFVKTSSAVDKKILIAMAARKLSSLGSILLYCPTPAQVISNAKVMLGLLDKEPDMTWGNDPDWVRFNLVCKECEEDEIYLKFAKKGILCHSAALKSDVRRFTERLLCKGKARYVYATNTLAQGVNLGVSTVIVVGTFISKGTYLTNRDFWNMAGRAGRSFVDTEGKILIVCDNKDSQTERKSNWKANQYLNSDSIDKVVSGVYQWLQQLKHLQEVLGVDFDFLLQLVTENNLNELEGIAPFFELIDDSLLSLDLSYRDDEDDDAKWVEEHFKHSLAVIQEEDAKERQKNIAILRARVFAVRKMTQGNNIPQAFASSGIPLNAALFLENQTERLYALADEYLQSDRGLEAKLFFFYQFDQLVSEIPTSRIIRYEMDDLDKVRDSWVQGDPLPYKQMTVAEKYYGYTFTWLMNALAARNAAMEDNVYKEFFEEMSLIAQYGLPTRWAVQIYLCGISSRRVAAELASKLEEPNDTTRLSYVARYLEQCSEEIQQNNNYSSLAKEWISAMLVRPASSTASIPSIPRFKINGTGTDMDYDRLICKNFEGESYLCSIDLKYHIKVKEKENMPFSKMADIPGVFFTREGEGWAMECHNPYVDVKY
jgi:hypothetical protein